MSRPSATPAHRRAATAAAAALALGLLAACASPAGTPASAPAAVAAPATAATPVTAAASAAAAAATPAPQDPDFARWVRDVAASARAAGISDATLHAAFDNVQFLPRVVELDRRQPEFTQTPWDYLDRTVSPQRVARGRAQRAQVGAQADAAAQRYGVPAEVLVAIWGMESSYGADTGDIPVIDALATLAFDGRRAAWARGQLLAALQILQRGDIDRARMLGSWAGAMGQTQFLPSTFLADAVDADGDGRRDIWGSLADVMASTAHVLARAGWQTGQPCAVEVRLPPGFDPGRADDALRQPAGAWAAEGVQPLGAEALPAWPATSLLLPAGVRGPAFLVGANFRAILRYNNATTYALAVCLLAQGVAGGPGVQAAWPRDQIALSRSQLTALQTALNARGFDSGTPDGLMGPATRAGIRAYQRSVGLPADGQPTAELLERLQQP